MKTHIPCIQSWGSHFNMFHILLPQSALWHTMLHDRQKNLVVLAHEKTKTAELDLDESVSVFCAGKPRTDSNKGTISSSSGLTELRKKKRGKPVPVYCICIVKKCPTHIFDCHNWAVYTGGSQTLGPRAYRSKVIWYTAAEILLIIIAKDFIKLTSIFLHMSWGLSLWKFEKLLWTAEKAENKPLFTKTKESCIHSPNRITELLARLVLVNIVLHETNSWCKKKEDKFWFSGQDHNQKSLMDVDTFVFDT